MARRSVPAAASAIRFVADFDHVSVGKTVAYKAGDIVADPSEALLKAAGEKAVPYAEMEPDTPGHGEA